MKQNIFKILIKTCLIVVGVLGIVFSATSSAFMGNNSTFLYFTIQSNITIIAITIVFLINDIFVLFKRNSFINNFLLYIKYIFTVAITITFLVFTLMLAPTLNLEYLVSFNNISVHFIVPILALIDFFVYDYKINLTKQNCLLGLLMPLYYLIFFLIGTKLNFVYGENSFAPYFFLDFKKYGWFSFNNGLGVFYWILILLVVLSLLCLLFYIIMKKRKEKTRK